MFKYTKTTLQKIETIFEEIGYKVRYERGSFQSGYCMVENKQIAVINKFFDTEGRINVLLEILSTIDDNIDENNMTEKSLDFYQKINKLSAKESEVEEPEPTDVKS